MDRHSKRVRELVRRAQQNYSKQPRFNPDARTYAAIYSDIADWLREGHQVAPDYKPDSRQRDKWLREFWRNEPHWAGCINQTVLVDSSRGWRLIGGRNQVLAYTRMMHEADDKGWREFFRKSSLSYRVTDMGSVTETGRDEQGGPLRAIYHVDSARCRHTGSADTPLQYTPSNGKSQKWEPGDYFNVCSMPSDDEAYHGLGYCATSRAYDLVRLLYGVLQHDLEAVGAAMPKGLLLLHNISQSDWEAAMRSRKAKMEAMERQYFGGVMVLASTGIDQIDARLVALSQLPENFDRKVFVDQVMYGYAHILAVDPREFWPVSSGALGTGTETEAQHRKAATKGAMEFPHSWQEQLQKQLPATLQFEFEERDAAGELLDAEVAQAWANVATTLYESGALIGVPLLERQQALSLLAERGVIPEEWSVIEEETMSTDTESARKRALEMPRVRRAMERFPSEPIIIYRWDGVSAHETVLWERGDDALKPRLWKVKRQADESEVLYENDELDFTITEADVDRAIKAAGQRVSPEFEQILNAEEYEGDEE